MKVSDQVKLQAGKHAMNQVSRTPRKVEWV